MKQALAAVLVLFLFSCNSTKKEEFSLKLIPVKQGDYWGYIDKDGKFVVNPQFRNAYTFSGDRALVQNTEGKYGFIDMQGKLVISPIYKSALYFSEGLAAVVKENQKLEYIDNTGNTVLTLDANMETAQNFHDGLAMVEINGKKSFIDRTGKIVFGCPFEYVYEFHDGFALMSMKIKDKTKYGFIDKTGRIAINPTYDEASPFYNGMSAIEVDDKYGFIDNTGKTVINPQFEDVLYFTQDLIAVKQGELWGFVDKAGKFAINPQYKEVGTFTASGLCPVKSVTNSKWGFIDKEGKTKIEPQFDKVTDFYDEVSVALLDKKYGLINKDGKYLVNPQYEAYELFPYLYNRIKSDFFDISAVTAILFRDMTSTAIRGIEKGQSFTSMQSKFPDLTHDNYNSLKNFTSEENNSMYLDEIDFMFNDGFTKSDPKYKTELRYNSVTGNYENVPVLDITSNVYDDNAPLKAISFNYKLQTKAREKAGDIIKALKDKLPQNFSVESPDSSTYILSGSNYYLGIVEENDYVHLVIAFEKSTMDMLKNPKNNSSNEYKALADTAAVKK